MAEAVILSMIEKLENCRSNRMHMSIPMDKIINEMRHIVELVRDKKFGEGRRLSFLVSDLVHMAHDSLDLEKKDTTFELYFIASWIGEMEMRMLKLGVDGAETESSSENVDQDVVVGLDKHIEMVLRTMIFHTQKYRPLLLIKGMSGIGKTTLAREIYNHPDVIERFKYRAWVCVSNVTTLKDLIIKLLQHAVVDVDGDNLHTLEEMDNQSLLYMLHQHLQGLPYLIVLDDLPKQIYLGPLWGALQKEVSDGSKLVVTSHVMHRFLKYKLHDVHRMEPLDSITSWQLFYKTINSENKLRSGQKFPKELKYQGKQMLRKCGGLPLAIKEVANQLAQKKASTGTEWEQLLQSVDFGSTLELLESYYQKLDYKLQPFFRHMALFKENTNLRENKLSQIWEAAGALPYRDSYIIGLVDESVIDEVNDKSRRYRMNLEVLDIAQNLMVQVPDIIWEIGTLCHLYMSDVICKKPFKIDVLQWLKTLTSVSVDNLIYELSGFKMLDYLEKLGVQDLDGNTHVCKLFVLLSNLDFLDQLILRGYRFRSMPCLDELGTLQYVKTLKLDGRLDRLPNSFPSHLSSLTLANSCLDEDPMPLLGKLPYLLYLKLLNAYTGQHMEIIEGDFTFFRVLCIEELWNLRYLQIEKGALRYLDKLEIRNCPYLDTLPKEARSILKLEELKMVTTKTISTNIRNSHSIFKIRFVNIRP